MKNRKLYNKINDELYQVSLTVWNLEHTLLSNAMGVMHKDTLSKIQGVVTTETSRKTLVIKEQLRSNEYGWYI